MAMVPSVWEVEASTSPVMVISCSEAVLPRAPPALMVTWILPLEAFSTYSLNATAPA